MAAPVADTRQKPNGRKLKNGFRALLTLEQQPDIAFWEKEVTFAGIDGGEPINISDQHNETWETFGMRALKQMTPVTIQAGYDPAFWDDILAMVNVEQTVTETNPNSDQLAYYGALRSAVKGPQSNGVQPMCTIVIQPTNTDPITGAEEDPVFTGTPGTGG